MLKKFLYKHFRTEEQMKNATNFLKKSTIILLAAFTFIASSTTSLQHDRIRLSFPISTYGDCAPIIEFYSISSIFS